MCARRNPDSHIHLIGQSAKCDATMPHWQGNYPKGLSRDEFNAAQAIRADMLAQGCRNAEIVEALEERFGRTVVDPSQRLGDFAGKANIHLLQLLVEHWKQLKWHRSLDLYAHSFVLGSIGTVDLVATDSTRPGLVLVELQLDRDDAELIETVLSYKAHINAPIEVEPVILLTGKSPSLPQLAKKAGIIVFAADVSVIQHISATGDQREVSVRVKQVNS